MYIAITEVKKRCSANHNCPIHREDCLTINAVLVFPPYFQTNMFLEYNNVDNCCSLHNKLAFEIIIKHGSSCPMFT